MEHLGLFLFLLAYDVTFWTKGMKKTTERNNYFKIKKKCVKPVPFDIDNYFVERKYAEGNHKRLAYEHTFEYSFETDKGWQSDKLVVMTSWTRELSVEDFKVLCSPDYKYHITEPYGGKEYPSGIIYIILGVIFTLCAISTCFME